MNANGPHVYLRLAKKGNETLLEMPMKFNLSPNLETTKKYKHILISINDRTIHLFYSPASPSHAPCEWKKMAAVKFNELPVQVPRCWKCHSSVFNILNSKILHQHSYVFSPVESWFCQNQHQYLNTLLWNSLTPEV